MGGWAGWHRGERTSPLAPLPAHSACAFLTPPPQVLVGYLVQHGSNADVPRVADRLLERLLDAFPALQVRMPGWHRRGWTAHLLRLSVFPACP